MNNVQGFRYHGEVYAKIIKQNCPKSKVIVRHNGGCPALFKLFSSLLCNIGGISNDIPDKINIYSSDGTTQLLTQPVYIQTRTAIEEPDAVNPTITRYKAVLKTVFSNQQIRQTTSDSNVEIRLIRTGSNGEEIIYATSSLSSDVINIADGTQVIIQWKLYIDNN